MSRETTAIDRHPSHQARHRILVVEDNPAEALLIEEAFSAIASPIDLQRAATGADALACLRITAAGWRPALVLLDDHLPDIRGPDLAEILATDPQYGQPLVVVLSGNKGCARSGAWKDWIEKPSAWAEWEIMARELLCRFLVADLPHRERPAEAARANRQG